MPSFIECIDLHHKTIGLGKDYLRFANSKKMCLNEIVSRIQFLERNDDLDAPDTLDHVIQVLTNITQHIEAKTGWKRFIQVIKNLWNALDNYLNGHGFISHLDRTKLLLNNLQHEAWERKEQKNRIAQRAEMEKKAEAAALKLQEEFDGLDLLVLRHRPVEFYNPNELEEEADKHIAINAPFMPVDISYLDIKSPKDALREFLTHYEGVCFGESHSSAKAKKFIIENLDAMQKLGLDTIFLEGAFTFQQPGFDIYLETGELDPQIKRHLKAIDRKWKLQRPYSNRGLIDEARKRGIRIVGYETKGTATKGSFNRRYKNMNYAAFRVIQKEKGAGKWVALMGTAHLNTLDPYMPGVPALTKTPSLSLLDSASKAKTFYAHQVPFEVDDNSFVADTMLFL